MECTIFTAFDLHSKINTTNSQRVKVKRF